MLQTYIDYTTPQACHTQEVTYNTIIMGLEWTQELITGLYNSTEKQLLLESDCDKN